MTLGPVPDEIPMTADMMNNWMLYSAASMCNMTRMQLLEIRRRAADFAPTQAMWDNYYQAYLQAQNVLPA